jgi:anaphase-promoting complex subunit 3
LRTCGVLTRVEISRFGLGNVYLKTGKTTLAEYHFRKALQLNPSNATIACCVGAVLEKLGKRAEALDMYDEAKAVAPESSLVRFKRVRLLVRMQRHEVNNCSVTSRTSSRS